MLAPTGTIGFMMDCDTTGIEPDFSLVKFKKLVGGGSMQIVNQTIPRALRRLGYPEETIEAIVEYIAEHGHVIDAPGLRPEHYEVFDCAMGERSIAPMGHVRMMAAVQPFLSGAISKTVNMPETATVEEIEDIYFQGWKLGLKALAIYRDNCKVGQPLSDAKDEGRRRAGGGRREGRRVPADPQAAAEEAPGADDVVRGRRRRGLHDRVVLPRRRPRRGLPQDVEAGLDPGRRHGRLLDRHLDRPAVRRPAGDVRLEVRQHALRAGRPDRRPGRPDGAVDHGLHLPPAGAGLPDFDKRSAYGIYSAEERARQLETGSYQAEESDEEVEEELETLAQSAPVTEAPTTEATAEASTAAEPAAAKEAPGRGALVGRAARGHHRQGRPTPRCA